VCVVYNIGHTRTLDFRGCGRAGHFYTARDAAAGTNLPNRVGCRLANVRAALPPLPGKVCTQRVPLEAYSCHMSGAHSIHHTCTVYWCPIWQVHLSAPTSSEPWHRNVTFGEGCFRPAAVGSVRIRASPSHDTHLESM